MEKKAIFCDVKACNKEIESYNPVLNQVTINGQHYDFCKNCRDFFNSFISNKLEAGRPIYNNFGSGTAILYPAATVQGQYNIPNGTETINPITYYGNSIADIQGWLNSWTNTAITVPMTQIPIDFDGLPPTTLVPPDNKDDQEPF